MANLSMGSLSSRVTLARRLHVTPARRAGNLIEFPLTETTYEPQGLPTTRHSLTPPRP